MRTTIFFAAFASVATAATAATYTVTETADVTITSCAPSVTDCPANAASSSGSGWENVSVSAPPAAAQPTEDCVDSGSEWQQWSDTNGAACPVYTATEPPSWISYLPASDSAKWSTGPPADWCSYSYTSAAVQTTTAAAAAPYPTGGPATTTVAGTGGYKPTTSAYPTYTGAANSNAGSFAFAGLAAAAALVLA